MLVLLELSWKKLNSFLLFSLFSNISKTNKCTFVMLLKFGNDTPVGNHWIDKYYVTNRKCENRFNTNVWLQFFKWYNLMVYDCNKLVFGLGLLNQCICFTLPIMCIIYICLIFFDNIANPLWSHHGPQFRKPWTNLYFNYLFQICAYTINLDNGSQRTQVQLIFLFLSTGL